MKKVTAIILAALITASLASCGGNGDESSQSAESKSDISENVSSTVAEESKTEESSGGEFVMSENVEKINSWLQHDIDTSMKAKNIFSKMKYTYSTSPASSYPDGSFTKLTDGITRDLFDKYNWVGFEGSSSVSIVFDIGSNDHRLSVVELDALCQISYGIRLPASVALAVSDDGEEYTTIGEITSPMDIGESSKYKYRFSLPKATSARYIKLTAKRSQGGFLFFDEAFGYEYAEDGDIDINAGEIASADEGSYDFYKYSLKSEITVPVYADASDYNTYQNLAKLDGTDIQIQHFDPIKESDNNTAIDSAAMLKDGKKASAPSYDDGVWFKFSRGCGRHVVVDLGNVMSVSALRAEFLNQISVGVGAPPTVYISVSTDGKKWTSVYGKSTIPYGDASNTCVYEFDAEFDKEYKARYVRMTFATVPQNNVSSMVFLSEVEVWGKKNSKDAVNAEENAPKLTFGSYPDPDDFGVKAIMLLALGDSTSKLVLTEDVAEIYYGKHDDNGKITDVFYDSYCFAPANQFTKTGNIKADSEKFIDGLFEPSKNLVALNSAVRSVNDTLGKDFKPTYWINLFCMGEKAESADALYEALKQQVDYALEKVVSADLENIKLAGFYYNDEYISREKEEITVTALKRLNEYLDSKNLMSLWCPYYNAYGIWRWQDAGFDIACLQPNYMFYATESTRLAACAELAKLYGMCVELEIEDIASEGSCAIYREYLRQGVLSGHMNSVQLYYEGSVGGAVYSSYGKKAKHTKAIYEDSYKYSHDLLDESYDIDSAKDVSKFPKSIDVEVRNGRQTFFELGNLEGLSYRYIQSPVYGKLRTDMNGKCCYAAMGGYKGTDTAVIEIYDSTGNKQAVTVNITVTE